MGMISGQTMCEPAQMQRLVLHGGWPRWMVDFMENPTVNG